MSDTDIPTIPKAIHGSPTSLSATKPIHSVPKSVQAMTHQKLPFEADWPVGLGYSGGIILGRDSDRCLVKMEYNVEEYKETWQKTVPDGIRCNCAKGISDNGTIFLQNNRDKETLCYDEFLTNQNILHNKGILIDTVNEEVFYTKGSLLTGDYKIIVHKTVMERKSSGGFLATALQKFQLGEHRTRTLDKPKTLKPSSPNGWKWAHSLCRTETGSAVVETKTSSMDIFDNYGRIYFPLTIYFPTEISVRK